MRVSINRLFGINVCAPRIRVRGNTACDGSLHKLTTS
jgi:hypothetical protein